jgi:hypothetical protein
MEVIKATDNIIKEQMFLIKQIFNTLDMNDIVNDFEKQTPHITKNTSNEYTPCDLILEEKCIFGNACLYKKDPLSCSKNHQSLFPFIRKNTIISNKVCKYERPWKNMLCTNMNCWYSHLKGRCKYVEAFKLKHKIQDS